MANQQQKPYNVTLIGDDCLDQYQYGTVDRISPEAPIPVFCPTNLEVRVGMAANVAANLRQLGVGVKYFHGKTSVKTRMIDQRSGQHLVRVDNDERSEPLAFSSIDFTGSDAVVISDYNKGTVSYELIEEIQHKVKLPVFLDTKKGDLARFGGCIVKINEVEWRDRHSDGGNVIVTHGGSHVVWGNRRYSVPQVAVFDVCGAGDTFLSALAYQYVNSSGDMDRSIEFAIKAATRTVQHLGVYAPTLEEIGQ